MFFNAKIAFVVCYEAGAAQIISSFLKANKCAQTINYCLYGPALIIFEQKLGKIDVHPLDTIKSLDSGLDIVITGRSFVPDLEREAIKLAKATGIKVATFLDHWVNYEDSFIPVSRRLNLSNEEFLSYLPDEVIIGDRYASELLKKTRIPGSSVRYIENEYFRDLELLFKNRKPVTQKVKQILYVSEPVYDDLKKIYGNGNLWGYNEFDVLKEIVSFTPTFKQLGFTRLVIRLHPNEKKDKYLEILRGFEGKTDFEVSVSTNKSLEEDILGSQMVLGMESMALVIAILAGVKAVSYLPRSSIKKCSLPHKELSKIDDLNLLKEIEYE